MPTPEEILASNAYLANRYMAIAVVWHVLIVFLLTSYILRKQMSSPIYYGLPAILFFSVSLMALSVLNFFNGLAFLILGVLFIRRSIAASEYRYELNKPIILRVAAFAVILSGLVYPHFLNTGILTYVVASPTGVVPCPTLLLASGISLLFVRSDDRSVYTLLIPANILYGVIGVFVLGVYLDIILLGVAVLQLVYLILSRRSPKISSAIQ